MVGEHLKSHIKVQPINTSRAKELDLNSLPAAPQLLLKLIDLFLSENTSFEELEALISRDTALSARVLAVANSAAYRQWNDVLDLKRILVALGTRAIKSLALSCAVHQFFSSYEETLGSTLQQIWFEALLAAHTARRIAELLAYPAPAEAHTVGLMHGIGKLALLSWQQQQYLELLQQSASAPELQLLEEQHFGVGNAELAAQIFEHWGLEPIYQQAARYQHSRPATLKDMPQLVKIVNTTARACFNVVHHGITAQNEDRVDDPFFGFNQSLMDEILGECRDTALKEAAAYGMDCKPVLSHGGQAPDTERIQLELARRVHRIALVDGLQPELALIDERAQLLAAIARQLSLIFGVHGVLFYLLDEHTSQLTPVRCAASSSAMPSHTIDFVDGQNLVSSSIARRQLQLLHRETAADHPSALDLQLLEAMGSEAILVIPLATDQAPLGAVVVDCPNRQFQTIEQQRALMLYFGQACAMALRQLDIRREQISLDQALQRQSEQLATNTLLHEVSSPLTIVSNYVAILAATQPQMAEDGVELRLIQQEIQRIAGLLTQFRSRDSEQRRIEGVNLNELIRQLLALLQTSLFELRQIDVELNLDEEMPLLQTESGPLRQILSNLLNNACEALPPQGRIQLKTRGMTVIDQTRYCELVIADSGPGIPPEVIRELFSPVISGKGGQHQGLGLTIVYQLVKRLQGNISYRKADIGGAEFAVLLPLENKT